MARAGEPGAGLKRGSGRAVRAETPAKKPKLSVDLNPSPSVQSPADLRATPDKRPPTLPSKITEGKPLPTLPTPQAADLPDVEYQSLLASGALQASLSRSQAKWTAQGIFERYWVKPETGRNARPPPPNNPEAKWMKHRGECRIRIEPHIFKCEMYTEEKPRPPPSQASFGQPYRPPHQPFTPHQQPYQQNRALQPLNQQPQSQRQQQSARTLPPINNTGQSPAPFRAPPPPPQQERKTNPDPVISKLAARASSDPELKSLMKEVATGNATQEQLRVFQRHIDELQKQIKEEKEAEERKAREAEAAARAREESLRLNGAADSGPASPIPVQYQTPQPHTTPQHQHQQSSRPPYPAAQHPHSAHQHFPQPQQQLPWVPPPPVRHPVVLAFAIPGATEDRFLFPEHAILETLSTHHLLASFIVTRTGRDAVDSTDLDSDKEYWQPVTLMLEVKYGLEALPEYVRKWVKPADEVRKHMEDIMQRCERAPEMHLALRLPFKGSAAAADVEENNEATSVVAIEDGSKSRSSIKSAKKVTQKPSPLSTPAGAGKEQPGSDAKKPDTEQKRPALATPPGTAEVVKEQRDTAAPSNADEPTVSTTDASTTDQKGEVKTETGRPRRALRKSVRISEG